MCHIASWPFPASPIHAKTGKPWLDVKVFCIRMNATGFSNSVQIPESLTLHFLPRSTTLEINERLFHPSSSAFLTLQRDRIEEISEGKVTYVAADTIRTSDNLCFEVYLRDEPMLFGMLEKKQEISEDLMPETTWSVECSSRPLEHSSKWSLDAMFISTVDIYAAGWISGFPIILTQTLQLLPRKSKRIRHCTLDVIPEGNETAESCSDISESDSHDSESSFPETNSGCDFNCDWVEVEEQKDSWVGSGLSFGIGIGLGMCLGVGLLLNTYQRTSRVLRKRIL